MESQYKDLTSKCEDITEKFSEILDSEDIENYGWWDKFLYKIPSDKLNKLRNAGLGIILAGASFEILNENLEIFNEPNFVILLLLFGAGLGGGAEIYDSFARRRKNYDGYDFTSIKHGRVYEDLIENPQIYAERS